ncbi:threonylcarbamoyl-AMP synthase [Patescibacteria group bacterium]|nr:threonylcarbamoyl-AMP synthase [Patescibacteria group bacterium]
MEILKVSPKNSKAVARIVIKLIKEGKVLVFPTDTVYGLLTDARNERAVKRIFEIKKRSKRKPIPIFVRDIKMAKNLAFINKPQEKFLQKIWPGKVTAVLKRRGNCGLPATLFGRIQTVGLRIPNYKLLNDLLEKLNSPLTGTSANISGQPPSTKIKKVINQFNPPPKNVGGQPDLILDTGNLNPSLPSTVIDLTNKKPKILREGAGKIRVKKLIRLENL